MKIRYYLAAVFLIVCSAYVSGQDYWYLVSRYDDDLAEWEIRDSTDSFLGTLDVTWPYREAWTEWKYRIGDLSGDIRTLWREERESWELIGTRGKVVMRTQWSGDFSVWQIQAPEGRFIFRSRFRHDGNEWFIDGEDRGIFAVYTIWDNDPRDWEIRDELDPDISFETKLAMVFLAMYHTIPKP